MTLEDELRTRMAIMEEYIKTAKSVDDKEHLRKLETAWNQASTFLGWVQHGKTYTHTQKLEIESFLALDSDEPVE